jgi:hypothetical protein
MENVFGNALLAARNSYCTRYTELKFRIPDTKLKCYHLYPRSFVIFVQEAEIQENSMFTSYKWTSKVTCL